MTENKLLLLALCLSIGVCLKLVEFFLKKVTILHRSQFIDLARAKSEAPVKKFMI